MKKMVALAAIAATAAAATFSYAGMPARTGVNGSYHDMNYYAPTKSGKQDVYNRVCVFCHTPHNALVDDGTGQGPLPLWGNFLTQKTQDPYQWATPANADGIGVSDDQLKGPSRLCMTCHDGTIAIDAHISNGSKQVAGPQNDGTLKLAGPRAIGSNDSLLTKTHPIGFDYVAAKNARNNPTTQNANGTQTYAIQEIVDEQEGFATDIVESQVQGTYNNVIRNGNRSIKSVLYGGTVMTCASCHEVHNKENAAQDAGPTGVTPNFYLYAKETKSLICLSCHVK